MSPIRFFPEEENPALRRIFAIALICLPPVAGVAALWGLEQAASALAGGALILLCGLWTHAAVRGGFGVGPKRMKRRLWWRVGWRFLLLAVALYAILRAPWIRPESLVAGLSLYFPAVLIELAVELLIAKR